MKTRESRDLSQIARKNADNLRYLVESAQPTEVAHRACQSAAFMPYGL